MVASDRIEKEIAAYQWGPFENPTIQEALTIIAVYAAQMDPENCEEDVKRIKAIAERLPEFTAKKESIFSSINKYVNSMQAFDTQKAVEIAADKLTPVLRKTAFKLSAEIALPDNVLTKGNKAVLDTLQTKLSIDTKFAQKTIETFLG